MSAIEEDARLHRGVTSREVAATGEDLCVRQNKRGTAATPVMLVVVGSGRYYVAVSERKRRTMQSPFPGMDPYLETPSLWPVSRKDRRPKGYVWPIRLYQRLPVIGIPLKEGDDDAPLDLQAVLATAYDRAAYDLQIDYRLEPNPPLSAEQTQWANDLLSSTGRRQGFRHQ